MKHIPEQIYKVHLHSSEVGFAVLLHQFPTPHLLLSRHRPTVFTQHVIFPFVRSLFGTQNES